MTLIGLTLLTTNGRPLVPPKLNRRRALLVLSKIDEILKRGERNSGQERDVRFVDLGHATFGEVRAGASTGGWTTSSPSMSSWRGSFRNRDVRPIT